MRALPVTLIVVCVVLLVVGLGGALHSNANQGANLVLPGSVNASVNRPGFGRLRVSFVMTREQNRYSIARHLQFAGWTRVRRTNGLISGQSQMFVRRSWMNMLREVAVVEIGQGRDEPTTINMVNCVTVWHWGRCF